MIDHYLALWFFEAGPTWIAVTFLAIGLVLGWFLCRCWSSARAG